MSENTWSNWVSGIKPEPDTNNWYKRDEESLNLDTLPTNIGGVYEIGIKKGKGKVEVCYGGKAGKCKREQKGVTLRARIYSRYAKNGDHLSNFMHKELENGFTIMFRWKILNSPTECAEEEALMIHENDYLWNQAKSSCSISKKEVDEYKKENEPEIEKDEEYLFTDEQEIQIESLRNILHSLQLDKEQFQAAMEMIEKKK